MPRLRRLDWVRIYRATYGSAPGYAEGGGAMICGHCPLLLIRGDRYYCERLEEEVNPNDDCLEDEEALS